jgi:deoxyribodipyrimidine photo-lyase
MPDPRLSILHDAPTRRGKYVVYWMQQSQRTICNHALEHAIAQANRLGLPAIVGFGLMDDYPEANERHYAFMLEGLADVDRALRKRKVKFVIRHGPPEKVAVELAQDAAMIVCDRGYLRHQRAWRDHVAASVDCRVEQVESDAVVPVEVASDHAEFAARTIRPKIHKHLPRFLKPLARTPVGHPSLGLRITSDFDAEDVAGTLSKLKLDRSLKRQQFNIGGEAEAQRRLKHFLRDRLAHYADARREPAGEGTSTLSAYLHFGQISPLRIALAVRDSAAPAAQREAFLEELIVRRELAMNFCFYTAKYDNYDALPNWAQRTLEAHRQDPRERLYSRQELESAKTADPYWNAAQREMVLTGYMHNSMRMYWGKQILAWKKSPQEAYADLLYLNNKYFLCGRDPNAYANVAWIFGLHDRPWGQRKIYGTVRYMNAAGLRRKFDMAAYMEKVECFPRRASNSGSF